MIDTRLFGSMAIFLLMIMIYQAWIEDYGLSESVSKPYEIEAGEPKMTDFSQQKEPEDLPKIDDSLQATERQAVKTDPEMKQEKIIRVLTDLLRIEIDLYGGNMVLAELRNYPLSLDKPDQKVRLMDIVPSQFFIAQSGLQSTQSPAPNHYALYSASQRDYALNGTEQYLVVPMIWQENGIKVTKTYVFERSRYVMDVHYKVENLSGKPWVGRQYRQLQRAYNDERENRLIYTYTGGVIYSRENKYEKIPFDEMGPDKLNRSFNNGWAAMIQHYFLSAWIPEREEENRYYTNVISTESGPRYVLGLNSQTQSIGPGESAIFKTRLYIGPKIQERMENIAEGLKLTVDYGLLTVISQPLFWLLSKIHYLIGNWGWSIVFLTLLIKLLFYKLSEAQYKSMANMRRVTPKLQAIRERYVDDRQRMSKAMMELYQKEKINPMGGCLPALVQIPVFIALYWVLLESVELRQAPFILWINDLSVKDPFFVLPLFMGITMYIQQKLNPAPVDPIQAKVFMMLPFIFTIFFAFFPAGLVLYWLANNAITIVQQWYITKKIIPNHK